MLLSLLKKVTESLCCIPETNTILQINYTTIKFREKKVTMIGTSKKKGFTHMVILLVGTLLCISFTVGVKSQNMFILKEVIIRPHPSRLAVI